MAAPNELAKYRLASTRPLPVWPSGDDARRKPALIRGKVVPSSSDCGRISSAAMPHLITVSIAPPGIIGKSVS